MGGVGGSDRVLSRLGKWFLAVGVVIVKRGEPWRIKENKLVNELMYKKKNCR